MSTRRSEPYFFDHGAQFFKVRTDEFKEFIKPMIQGGFIEPWNARFVEFKNREITLRQQWNEHYPHYVGVPGMNAIAKYLSHFLKVQLGMSVHSMKRNHDKWQLKDDEGNALGEYDWVISTIPAEQASILLPPTLPFFAKISAVKMSSCFTMMLGFEKNLQLEFDAALVRGEDINWIAMNSSKPKRNDRFCLLVNSTNKWADEHIDDNKDEVMDYLCKQTSQIIRHDLNKANHKALHGWRFANIEKQTSETHFVDKDQNIAVCGDWLIQGRVEAAFTSGFEMAKNILKSIKVENHYSS
jgi:predicted NAD/FAD-dependent oxidoreductase